MDATLVRQVRDELYHAKRLVRSVRNSTKTTAAALQDSEDRIDDLISQIESPQPEEAQGHGNKRQHAHTVK